MATKQLQGNNIGCLPTRGRRQWVSGCPLLQGLELLSFLRLPNQGISEVFVFFLVYNHRLLLLSTLSLAAAAADSSAPQFFLSLPAPLRCSHSTLRVLVLAFVLSTDAPRARACVRSPHRRSSCTRTGGGGARAEGRERSQQGHVLRLALRRHKRLEPKILLIGTVKEGRWPPVQEYCNHL